MVASGASSRAVRSVRVDFMLLHAVLPSESQKQAAERLKIPVVLANSVGMKLILVPAREFMMDSADGQPDEKPVHLVRITRPFYLRITETTQGQYEQVMGANPSHFTGDAQRPVEQVSWENAVELCRRLSQKEGKTYGLPTEAQWEYACRAGTSTKWYSGDNGSSLGDYAWHDRNSDKRGFVAGPRLPGLPCEWEVTAFIRAWDGQSRRGAGPRPLPSRRRRRRSRGSRARRRCGAFPPATASRRSGP